jgi:hypothetical protein
MLASIGGKRRFWCGREIAREPVCIARGSVPLYLGESGGSRQKIERLNNGAEQLFAIG